MPSGNDHLMKLVFGDDFALTGETTDHSVKPIPRQFALQPGDYAAAMTSESIVDRELSIMQLVDAEEHKDKFPDYDHRLMRSYVLADWKGAHDPNKSLGWFARSRLIPLTSDEYVEMDAAIENKSILNDAPDWFIERFREITDELAQGQPDLVFTRATCGRCGGREVSLHWTVEVEGASVAVVHQVDGKDVYAPRDLAGKIGWHAHLHCNDCNAMGELDEEEFEKPEQLQNLLG